jgi:branched-chain amino acid aminotransferase
MTVSENRYAEGLAYVDGEVCALADARLPLVEAGFTRSDVTYDVVAVWNGKFFRLDDHLARFQRSRDLLHLKPQENTPDIRRILMQLVSRSRLREAYVSMIATRGVSPVGSRDPRRYTNKFYAFACPYVWIYAPEVQERGVNAVVASVQRTPRAAFDPTIKNFQWGDLTRGLWEALESGAEAGILLDGDGNVTEGAGYNVFAIIDGILLTPDEGTLLGITRQTVLELAAELGIPAKAGPLLAERLRQADEVFFTSTAGGVMPVGTLDGRPLRTCRPGSQTLQIKQAYWAAHERAEWTSEVTYE